MERRTTVLPILLASLALAAPLPSQGHAGWTLGFDRITSNASQNIESQLSVEVSPVAGQPDQAAFKFVNAAGGVNSFISEVYFDDGILSNIASMTDSGGGVAFVENVYNAQSEKWSIKPADLPGGNTITPPFEATQMFTTQSQTNPLGVNPGEWLTLVFNLDTGTSYADVVDNLLDGDLRIGLHVQGIAGVTSDAFVNTVPLPASLLLGVFAVGLAGRKLRKFV